MRSLLTLSLTIAMLLAAARLATAEVATDAPPPAPPAAGAPGWPAGAMPHAPANFRVIAFARDLESPRALLVLPNGDVLVSESRGADEASRPSANRVTLLRDSTGAGVADERFQLVTGLERPVGLALRRDRLYIGNTDALVGCPFLVGQTRLHGECHPLADLPAAGGRDHWMRALALSPDETRLVVGVGSSGADTIDYRDRTEPERGTILTLHPDGRARRTLATGLRETGGLAFEPASGRLYATVRERTLPSGEPVPDFLARIEDGAFYGWPYAYSGHHPDPRNPADAAAFVAKSRAPELEFPPGSSPAGLAFYGRDHFPKGYRGGAFVALGGALAGAPVGFRVVAIPFADGKPSGPPADFLTGFVGEGAQRAIHGRPSAVAVATDGTLLVADDIGNTIWRVIFKCAACTPDPMVPHPRAKRPNG